MGGTGPIPRSHQLRVHRQIALCAVEGVPPSCTSLPIGTNWWTVPFPGGVASAVTSVSKFRNCDPPVERHAHGEQQCCRDQAESGNELIDVGRRFGPRTEEKD